MAREGLSLYLSHQFTDSLPQKSRGQEAPARNGLERYDLALPKTGWVFLHRPGACEALLGSVDPDPFQLFSQEKWSDRAYSWPLERARHQVLFAAIGQDVAESSDLRGFLVADNDVLIATVPEGAPPPMKPSSLFG